MTCKSKSAAVAALKTLSDTLPQGMQRDAMAAVVSWIKENFPEDFTPETKARIQAFYDRSFDDAARKGLTWQVEGGTPENGARVEVPFIFNSADSKWEPENGLPPTWRQPNPNILPKSDEKFSDNDDEEKL